MFGAALAWLASRRNLPACACCLLLGFTILYHLKPHWQLEGLPMLASILAAFVGSSSNVHSNASSVRWTEPIALLWSTLSLWRSHLHLAASIVSRPKLFANFATFAVSSYLARDLWNKRVIGKDQTVKSGIALTAHAMPILASFLTG